VIPFPWRIEGSFGGVDPTIVIVLVGATAAAIAITAVIARQLAQLQPKAPQPSQVQKASGEFDAWTERPKDQAAKDQEYYAMYGSTPGRASMAPARQMAAPPTPTSLSNVTIDLSGNVPQSDGGWLSESEPRGVPAPIMPPRMEPRGPSDEVIAPSHGRRVRDTSTGEVPGRPSFERSSTEAGAVSAQAPPAPSPRIVVPPLPSSTPPPTPRDDRTPLKATEGASTLPEGLSTTAPARAAFRGPSRGQTVVGAGQTGVQEGQTLSAATKSIRCPKCQTVFVGPAARPATVKCPACGTTGTLR
jgi:hypothetical protein